MLSKVYNYIKYARVNKRFKKITIDLRYKK